jgi:hypothetical protein
MSATIPTLVGMLIAGYILYLLLSPKGAVVFSRPTREIIARTPHVKYRTSPILKVALGSPRRRDRPLGDRGPRSSGVRMSRAAGTRGRRGAGDGSAHW